MDLFFLLLWFNIEICGDAISFLSSSSSLSHQSLDWLVNDCIEYIPHLDIAVHLLQWQYVLGKVP